MAPFVAMERERGSLIAALEEREAERRATEQPRRAIFTTLKSGLGTLTEVLTSALPQGVLQLGRKVRCVQRTDPVTQDGWIVRHGAWDADQTHQAGQAEYFDEVILATPGHVTAELLKPIDRSLSRLLPIEASSAVLVALAWKNEDLSLPRGFGFLVPPPHSGAALAG